jgi:hypothetical protein
MQTAIGHPVGDLFLFFGGGCLRAGTAVLFFRRFFPQVAFPVEGAQKKRREFVFFSPHTAKTTRTTFRAPPFFSSFTAK